VTAAAISEARRANPKARSTLNMGSATRTKGTATVARMNLCV
jgi:hypothetical protein